MGISDRNTAQFYFRTNSDTKNYYGYYAIIKAVEYHTNIEVEIPTQSGKTFVGWYTDSACTEGNEFDKYTTLDDIVVYAKWQ